MTYLYCMQGDLKLQTQTQNMYDGESNENLKYFYLVIY